MKGERERERERKKKEKERGGGGEEVHTRCVHVQELTRRSWGNPSGPGEEKPRQIEGE